MRYKITAIQDTAIGVLWFALRMTLSKKKGWAEFAEKFNVSFHDDVVAISFENEDVSVADICFSVGRKIKIISSSCYFSDVDLDIDSTWLKDLFGAISNMGDSMAVLDARLIKINKTKGAFELKIHNTGVVYLEFKIGSMGTLRILNCGAVDNPNT